jgi:hypothetical protein
VPPARDLILPAAYRYPQAAVIGVHLAPDDLAGWLLGEVPVPAHTEIITIAANDAATPNPRRSSAGRTFGPATITPTDRTLSKGSGDCLGANQNTLWGVEMKTCDDTDTLFIYNIADNGCAGSYCYTVSVRYGLTFTDGIAWLCGYTTSNSSGALVTGSCPSPGSPRWD